MLEAEQELLRLGQDALPVLESLFTGDAKNQFGVPYRKLPLPLTCALEVVCRLGPVAKPLEPHLREELRNGRHTAAMALGALGSLDELSIMELAQALQAHDLNLLHEAAAALIRCRQADHELVSAVAKSSERASAALARMRKFLTRRTGD
jgi:hypothetical protein